MEFVWVSPRSALLPGRNLQGFLALEEEELEDRILGPLREEGFFMERRYAESHSEFKQAIPYVAVTRPRGETAADEGACEVLCLTRLVTQTERRLHGLASIGVGGHVNPVDQPGHSEASPKNSSPCLIKNACLRELNEELVLPDLPLPLKPLGVLNDDSSAVGSVHLGIVYRLDSSGLELAVRETSAMAGSFEPLARLVAASRDGSRSFETWSTLLLQSGALDPLKSDGPPGSDALRAHLAGTSKT